MTMLLLLFACATEAPAPGDSGLADSADTAADSGDPQAWDTAEELNGHWAAERIPAPEFVATNRDGAARSKPDLVGHPTVLWFYPAATTAG